MGQKDKNLSFIELEMGKMPPQAIELEEAILGAIMLEKNCLEEYYRYLSPELFYRETHQIIFTIIAELFNANKEVDILTVTQELNQRNQAEKFGGMREMYAFVSALTGKVASSANIGTHIEYVRDCFVRREAILLSSKGIENAYNNPNPYETIADMETGIDSINRFIIGVEREKTIAEDIEETYQDAIQVHGKELTGVNTGIKGLNEDTLGWQNSDLIILAGRTSMGKTALALKFAEAAGIPVAIFSLEMTKKQLIGRRLTKESGITGSTRKINWDNSELARYEIAKETLKKQQIHINDKSDVTPRYINAYVRNLNKRLEQMAQYERTAAARREEQKKVGLIVIDYLQLMSANDKAGNREQEIASISRSLKKLAKDLNIPIIALSQLNRDIEKRTGKYRPQLSDLRESGAIEQDADMVIFTYRPHYYTASKDSDKDYKYRDMTQAEYENTMEIIVSKHRNGPLFSLRQFFYKSTGRFEETNADKEEHTEPEQIDLPF